MTSTSSLNEALAAAGAALAEGRAKDSLQFCKAALKSDRNSTEALMLIGKAACHLKEYQQGELAFRRALEAKPGLPAAWQGLADLFAESNNVAGEIEANEQVLQLTSEEDPRDRQARLCLADAYSRSGLLDKSVQQYLQVLKSEAPGSQGRLDLLCRLADVMLKHEEATVVAQVQEHAESRMSGHSLPGEAPERTISCLQLDILAAQAAQDGEEAEASLTAVLAEITEVAPPALVYLRYREEFVRHRLLRIFHAPPRSTARQQFRLEALRDCVSVLCHGAACSPLPYEAAMWLLEEEEEITGGQVSVGGQEVGGTQALAGGVQAGAEGHIGAGRSATVAYATENFSRRLIHQFPNNVTARVLLTLMLRRHAMHSHVPVPQARRRQLEKLLAGAMEDDSCVDCASGYKALAELQYENRSYEAAVITATRGLRWLQERRERGHEALSQVALGLRLQLAKSLRRLGRLDEAERHFNALAGWVTEGEAAFAEMCGSTPTSIHQQALRGIALVALERGDLQAARAQYERILGKAALGRGPAEHWAHGDYGWLLVEDGDLHCARQHLEQALHVATEEGCAATDSQVGEHRYRLGEAYWRMKGRYRTDKQFAYTQFLEAAKVEGHAQASALAALGRYLEQIDKRPDAAERCFKKALAIDPNINIAGDGLCAHLMRQGRKEAAVALCREVVARAPQAVWAWRRLGYLLLQEENKPAEAIVALQSGLRVDPKDAAMWEALGAAYQPIGRLTAALKAYGRALELDPTRVYSLVQSGNLHLSLGNPAQSLECHEAALAVDADHPTAMLGASEALSAAASANIGAGALAAASKELERAAELAGRCAVQNGTLLAAWKQLGDTLLLHCSAPPSSEDLMGPGRAGGGAAALSAWHLRIEAGRQARRAYAKAVHLHPGTAASWHDASCTFYHEAQLLRAATAVAATANSNPAQLSAAAERLLRGALRLDPASAELWTALGISATATAVREYALSRALQLDPRSSTAWVALARAYIEAGEAGLAERCLQQGRSQDPAVATIWEAMAALAALSPTGEKDRAEFNSHAVGLGAGPEGLLGFVHASLGSGKGGDGGVYAAARRAAEKDPLNPAALNAWGLASEARGNAAGAVKAYKTALELLSGATIKGRGGKSEISAAPLLQHSSTTAAGTSLKDGIRLNLARALAAAGLASDATLLWGDLEYEGLLDDQPHAWLGYAAARASLGDGQGAEYAATMALESAENDGAVAAAALEALMQLKLSSGPAVAQEAVVVFLQRNLERLESLRTAADDVKRLWCVAMAAAAVAPQGSGPQAAAATMKLAMDWAAAADQEDADFFGKLRQLEGDAGAISSGTPGASIPAFAKALHCCPWAPELRLALAAGACEATPGYAPAAISLLRAASVHPTAAPELLNSSLAAVAAAILEGPIAAGIKRAKEALLRAAAAVHGDPTAVERWYIAALLATLVAAGEQTSKAHGKAASWCCSALAMLQCRSSAQQAQQQTAADTARQSRLLLCLSECQLRLSKAGEKECKDALESATAAVELAPSAAAKADALRQVGRCHWAAGDTTQAELFLRQSMDTAGTENSIAAAELARLLEACGRGQDAAEVLWTEASRLQSETHGGEPRAAAYRRAGIAQQLLLHRALTLAALGDLEEACSAAQDATLPTKGAARGLGLVAQGALRLRQAIEMGPESGPGIALLADARRLFSEAVHSGQDGVVARALLAQVESSGAMRKKEERVAAHAVAALRFAARPVPGELLSVLGGLQRSKTLLGKAVFTAPWEREWWQELKAVAAA